MLGVAVKRRLWEINKCLFVDGGGGRGVCVCVVDDSDKPGKRCPINTGTHS